MDLCFLKLIAMQKTQWTQRYTLTSLYRLLRLRLIEEQASLFFNQIFKWNSYCRDFQSSDGSMQNKNCLFFLPNVQLHQTVKRMKLLCRYRAGRYRHSRFSHACHQCFNAIKAWHFEEKSAISITPLIHSAFTFHGLSHVQQALG